MLKVFEAFAGYGSQRLALKNINIPHEIVGISEIDADAILSYAAIHENLSDVVLSDTNLTSEKMWEFLENLNVPLDYKTFKNKARNIKGDKLKNLYIANIISKNYGDIRKISPSDLPDFDFFTYSFPCQDISIAGYQNGLNVDSGTRSSLLWECCKIIEYKKPKYLMMENVKNLVGKNHINNFNEFLKYLESLGYKNYWDILNAKDYGVPQSRERVFCISVLNSPSEFAFPMKIPLLNKIDNYLDSNVPDNFYLNGNQYTEQPIKQDYIYCLDSNYWKGATLNDFQKKCRRQLVSGLRNNDGKYPVRRLTPLETWRFMGCSDVDFFRAQAFVSNTNLYRQAGNSIVVPVLEHIFKSLFNFIIEEETQMDKNKQQIIDLFNKNVKGKSPDVSNSNQRHDGKKGHWLEKQFGISANATNGADFLGYELKNETTSKTTFGDWSANIYIFKDEKYKHLFNGNSMPEKQDDFCRIFGKPNEAKDGRCSWSGSPCPKINNFNDFGQKLEVLENLDIVALYSYSQDKRPNKNKILPKELQKDNITLAHWFGLPSANRKGKFLKDKLEDKFNDCGWFTCKTDSNGLYSTICFGDPMTYDNWIKLVKLGIVFFDSGMYQGNKRPYSQWRADNKYWESLITDKY